MPAILALVFLTAMGAFTVAPRAADSPAGIKGDPLQLIEARLGKVETVAAKFTQVRELAAFTTPITITGRISLAKPDKFAWIVEEPIRYSLVVDGQTAREWDEQSHTTRTISLSDNMVMQMVVQQMRSWFSGDYRLLSKEFQISVDSQHPLTLSFTPKAKSAVLDFVERVRVAFRDDSTYISAITIDEPGGNRTEIRFSDTKLNQGVPDGVWEAARPR